MNTFLAIIIVALAATRIARAIAVDDISAPFRAFVNAKAWSWELPEAEIPSHERWALQQQGIIPMDPEREATAVKLSRPWAWFYGLVSCQFCIGFWLSFLGWWIFAGWHPSRPWWIEAVAVAGAQSIFAAKGTS